MRGALLIPVVGLLAVSSLAAPLAGCSDSGNDPDAQQLARINKELALLSEQMTALAGRVEQLERRETGSQSDPDEPGLLKNPFAKESPGSGPRSSGEAPEVREVVLAVATTGALSLDGTPVAMDGLGNALRREDGKPVQLIIRAAPEAPHATVIAIMEVARQSGIDRIAIQQGTDE